MADGLDLSELVRRTVQANAKFYKGWMELSFEYVRGISEILGGATQPVAPVQEADTGAGALVLEGEAGGLVRGSFLVSNDMDKPVSCAFVGSDFKDPRGATVVTRAAFEPPSVVLAPGEQRVVQVTIPVDESLSPGVGYAGEILVRGMDGFAVPVVLRRHHTVEHPASEDDTPPGERRDTDATVAAERTPRGKRAPKKGGRRGSRR